MEVVPAVDIMRGKVARLLRGDPRFVTSYEYLGNPVRLAKRWEEEGARIIHIVDLDAALGLGENVDVIEKIIESIGVSAQVGGGIRSLNQARELLGKGATRVVLGSLAFDEPSSLQALLRQFGEDHVVVALDNLDGMVVVQGWKASADVSVDDAVVEFSKLGAKLFLVTSVVRDGTLSGPDLETLARLCCQGIDVIAAGGIGSLGDIAALKRLGVREVVIGKALYEGLLSLREALRLGRHDP